MDKTLKTAYELSQTRWIMPSERPLDESEEDQDTFVDFVDSWKNPDKDDQSEYDSSFVPLDEEQKSKMRKKKVQKMKTNQKAI